MLDMGFFDAIRSIISLCPKQRQTLLFSATYPSEIKSLASEFMKNPKRIMVEESHTDLDIEQIFYEVNHHANKYPLTINLQKRIAELQDYGSEVLRHNPWDNLRQAKKDKIYSMVKQLRGALHQFNMMAKTYPANRAAATASCGVRLFSAAFTEGLPVSSSLLICPRSRQLLMWRLASCQPGRSATIQPIAPRWCSGRRSVFRS